MRTPACTSEDIRGIERGGVLSTSCWACSSSRRRRPPAGVAGHVELSASSSPGGIQTVVIEAAALAWARGERYAGGASQGRRTRQRPLAARQTMRRRYAGGVPRGVEARQFMLAHCAPSMLGIMAWPLMMTTADRT